jgi:hypothetical protein
MPGDAVCGATCGRRKQHGHAFRGDVAPAYTVFSIR